MGVRAGANKGITWTDEEIKSDCKESTRLFRLRRMKEPLADYLAEFAAAETAAEYVIDRLAQILAVPTDRQVLADLIKNPALNTALRYVAAPPISKDDLNTVLCKKISATIVRKNQDVAEEVAELIRQTIDPKRFPWVVAGVDATPAEMLTAKMASAVAATIQRVQTKRRGDEKNDLEGSVVSLLDALGFTRVSTPRTSIDNVEDLPRPGEYMTGATLGNDNGDCVIGLFDRRRLVVECKSSNSEINSRKRLNKEVVQDARHWAHQFGNQVLTAAALRGVFKPSYVLDAQETPIMILWEHRLEDLRVFIESTKQ